MKGKLLILMLFFAISARLSGQNAPLMQVNIPAQSSPVCDGAGVTALTAVYPTLNQTTSYVALPVDTTFLPPFPTTGGTLLNATQDDVWSPVVNLPFNFAFYGIFYNQVIVGSNGVISFDVSDAGGYCPWAFSANVPSPLLPTNAIFGVYQDTNIASPPVVNPAIQNVNYYVLDTGANQAPNRVFVVNFNELPQFSCNNGVGLQTSQIVIHEGSNIIDFFVDDRTCCSGWNGGSGVIGIQNATGTVGSVSHQTGCYSVDDDHYQIVPTGPTVTTSLQWYQGGTNPTMNVNAIPPGSTAIGTPNQNPLTNVGLGIYTAVVTYTYSNGTTVVVSDYYEVVPFQINMDNPVDVVICTTGTSAPYTVDIDQTTDLVNSAIDPNPLNYDIKYYVSQADAIGYSNYILNPGAYITSGPFPQTIWVRIEEVGSSGCVNYRPIVITDGPQGTFTYASSPYCRDLTTPQAITLGPLGLTTGGTFTALPNTLAIDPTTGEVTPSTSPAGNYTVTYTIPGVAPCPDWTTTATVNIVNCGCIANTSASVDSICLGSSLTAPITYTTTVGTVANAVVATGSTLPAGLTLALVSGVWTVDGIPSGAGTTTYTITLTDNLGQTCDVQTTIAVLDPSAITGTLTVCQGSTTALADVDTPAVSNPWVSSNTAVATVSSTGVVTGVSAGSSNITFTNLSGCDITVTVTVNPLPTITGTFNVCAGLTTALASVSAPATANAWVSASPAIASVSATGVVTGNAAGTAVITFTDSNGCTDTETITVTALPVITGTLTVCDGSTTTLASTATPAAVNPWLSSSTTIATVSNTGVVTGNAPGTTTITFTNSNGCIKTAIVTVTALPVITGTLNVCDNSTTTLASTATPATVNPWVSSNTAVATISNAGVVTGVTPGTSNITFTDVNGCTDMKTVTVIALPVITGTLTVCDNATTTLASTATPAAPNPWSSSNTTVATITAGGVLTGVNPGTSTITFTNSNGCIETAVVTVGGLATITAPAVINQSPCEGSAATPIVYTIGGSANSVVVTGLPAGMSHTLIAQQVTISGTPSAGTATGSPYTYAIYSVGPCGNSATLNGTITVLAPTTVSLAALSDSDQEPCIGNAITPITYNYGGSANAISVLGLPNGLIQTPVANGIRISGTPSDPVGSYNYTVTATGPCASAILAGTIQIMALPVITGTLTVCDGSTTTLASTATPAAVNPWVSSSPAIASIDALGVVTGNTPGTATITYTNSNGCINTAIVTVTALPIITGTLTVCDNSTTTLASTATPATVNPWVSSNTAVATVSNAGVVTGVSAGTSNITFTDVNGCTDMKTVTVIALPVITGTLTVCDGLTTTLASTAAPAVPNPWSSSNLTVATITAGGVVTAINPGTSTITYTNSNGCIETAIVTVVALPTITGTLSVCEGSTTALASADAPSTVNPWVSSNTAVATVSNTGVVSGVSAGSSNITFTNSNGCVVTVNVTVNPLPIITGTSTVCAGLTTALASVSTPAAANAWVSASPAIASVSGTGLVTGNAAGTAVITFTDSNGCTDTETITVIALPVITGTLTVCDGSTTTLASTATPAAVNPWVSSSPAIASIDALGVVTGNTPGTATITYTNSNGCINTAIVTVTALPIITGTLTVCDNSTTTLASTATPATVNPWVSSNTAVATVSNAGVVTGVSAGTSNITFTDVNGCTDMKTVTVIALPVITGTLTVCDGLTTTLASTAAPAVPNPWSSSNLTVATITAGGVVTAINPGTSTITYTNSNGCIETAIVTVVALPTITGTLSVCEGSTTALASADAPSTVNPWVSSNTAVATVSNTGVVSGVSAGSSNITFTNSNGCVVTVNVTVNPLPIITGTSTVCAGLTTALASVSTPAAANAWVSASPAIASVSGTGLVTGNAAGTAVITFTDSNGCTDTETITVIALPVITGTLTVCDGSTTTLASTATPAAVNPWVSSSPAIASIDALGVVTGNTPGTATITYTNSNGCINTAIVTVTALPIITGTLTVCDNSTTTLASTATPATVNPWVSSNTAVATVSNTGVVTGVTPGTSNITFTDVNGCTDMKTVTVNPLPVITGTFNVCVGQTTALASTAAPATSNAWVSSNTAAATISATGVVSGIAQGTTIITYTDSNGCSSTQTVTILALPTVTGTTTLPATCQNVAIANVVYTFGGSATGLEIDPATSLPTGLAFNTTTSTLSGAPTTPGSYTFNIRTVGGCSPSPASISVTIIVKPNATMVLTSGTANVTSCMAIPIIPIVFTFGSGATSASITAGGLPTGITGAVVGNTYVISGSASNSGSFTYEVTTSGGGCVPAIVTGVIDIKQNVTLQLTSGTSTIGQPVCMNAPIAPIRYLVGNNQTSTVTVNGLPPGINFTYSPLTGVLEISGSSTGTAQGTYNYTVTATNCGTATTTGSIHLLPNATIALSSAAGTNAQTVCVSQGTNQEAIIDIKYLVGNGATGASIVSGTLPSGIQGSFDLATLTFTLTGAATQSGSFTYKIETSGGCKTAFATGTMTVIPLPVINLTQDAFICVDKNGVPITDATLTTGVSASTHTFIWSDAAGVISGANGSSYIATTPGVYSVKVTNNAEGCYDIATTTVITSFAPQSVSAIATSYFADEPVVTLVVTPPGNYLYQVDGGAWQESNQFYDLPSGEHSFKVKDKIGCGDADTSIVLIDYPRYFTPNNDGYNDTWNIGDLNMLSNQETSKIEIYDRYGKLLKQISPKGTGWDGTVNGYPLPSTDYWFKVYYNEEQVSKTFKAHFSLKR